MNLECCRKWTFCPFFTSDYFFCVILKALAVFTFKLINFFFFRTYVAFGDKARDLGVSAKNKHITNVKNTVFNFKRLIGLPFIDFIVEEERPFVSYGLRGFPNDQIGIEVS